VKVVLDAGAFVATERGDRRLGAMLRVLQQRKVPLRTSAAVVAQVWRDGRKQARIAQLLGGVSVAALAPDNDRRTGELLARARTDDVIDAHLALEVEDEDRVLTSDPDDLEHLLDTRGVKATIVTL
jgi:hypothetical protein